MIDINKDTVVCISIATRPSNFGMTVHNAAYHALGLNFIYKAFHVSDIAGTITGVRALGIRGCSVTMPFKETVIQYLDILDDTARIIGAVNTIVNDGKYLTGYNTDLYGAKIVLQTLDIEKNDNVLLLGSGGIARAIKHALQQLKVKNVTVTSRNYKNAEKFIQGKYDDTEYSVVPWFSRNEVNADILINATPIGMKPDINTMPINLDTLHRYRTVIDVVVSPIETMLIKEAKKLGKSVVHGYEMSLHQAAAQFLLYTGIDAPLDIMQKSIMTIEQ